MTSEREQALEEAAKLVEVMGREARVKLREPFTTDEAGAAIRALKSAPSSTAPQAHAPAGWPGEEEIARALCSVVGVPCRDLCVDCRHAAKRVLALRRPPLQCAECDCQNPPDDCNWIKPGPFAQAKTAGETDKESSK